MKVGKLTMAMKHIFQNCKQTLVNKPRNKPAMVFLSTLLWGIMAHAYGFLHASFAYDALNAVYVEQSEKLWKIAIGRIFVNLYRNLVRGGWAMPWLIGILSLLFIAIAAILVADIFDGFLFSAFSGSSCQ